MITELFGNSGQEVSDPVLDRLRLATLGSYDIAGELGRGGMAIVYVARDLKLARTVAIKVMDPRLALAQGMADRFLQEARIAAQLQHPNIIVVHEIQHNGELIFFVMGLVEGGSLDELCRPGEPLPIEQARWILLQGARSLAFAHSEGITHRDVKPANILVNVKGDVILTDFGIAKAVGGDSMTKSGTQIGTPTYMSPEQFGNVAAGPASDQYALGVTAYRLLTGETPFSGDLYQLIGAHLNSQPVPLRDVRPDCPAFLANAVMRMLEKKPEHRWPSLDDVIAVFGANMAVDGGVARKQLAMAARALHRQRATSVSALTARAPLSPTPTNAAPVRPLAALADSLVVSISPPGATIFVRGTLQLKATVMQESGEPLTQGKTVWSSADPSVATVSEDGVLEGLTPGVSMVRATAHGAWEEAMIRVEPAPIARVTVTNPKITIRAGDTISPVVRALDVNGVTREDVSFAWTSRAPAIVDVESPGRIRALAPGEAVVEVSVGQMRRLIEVTVLRRAASSVRIRRVERRMELGDGYALHVDVVDDQGNPAPPGSVQWASSEPASVYVDSMGTVLAIGPGVSRITATVDDASDSIEFESIELPVAAIEVVLEHARVEIGETVGVELRVRDSAGSQRSVTGIRVWSSAPEIASVNVSSMTVHGVSAGTAHIHAACNDATNGVAESSAPLRVAAIAVERVHVVPPTLELEVGTVAAFAVHCLDAKGRELSNANTTVDCAVVSVAAIDSTGILRGVAAGATEMRVRVQNDDGRIVEARVPVRVRKAGLARFAITAPHETLTAGDTLDLAVLAWDTTGQPITDVSPVWRSSDATVATVNTTGRVYARRAGQVVVSAELGGRTERFALPIAAAPLASLTIQAPTKDLTVGVVTRLAVNAIDLSGAHVQPAVRYSADPADAARIHGNELTPLRAGSLTIRAHVTDAAPTSSVTAGVREAIATVDVRAADVREVTANSASNRRPAFSPRTLMVAAGVIVVAVLAWVFRPSSNPDSQVTALAAPPATAAAAAPEPSAKAVASNKAALILDKKSVVVTLGDSAVVSARIDSAGSRISGSAREVKWRSLDESKATVSANGVVHTRHVGLTRLIATRGTLQDTIAVNIAPRERQLTSIKISGAENDFPIGSSQQLSVEFLDAQQLAMTRDLPAVRWSTSDAKTASVSPSGSVTMLAEKTAVISATTGALSTKVTVHGKRAAPTPVVLSPQEEFEATLQTFDRSPSDRAVARTTRSKLDSLESLLAPSEQARVALYTGRAADALDQKDDACRALARALTLRPATNVASQIEESRRKAGCIAAEAPKPEPATNTGKKQSELKAELDSAVVRYTRAFESHDAARVRAAFPSIPKGKLDGYANMFREAREITVTLGAISTASDPLSEVVGSTVEVTVPVRVLFKPKSGNPSDSRTEWKMRLQRTANGWILVALE